MTWLEIELTTFQSQGGHCTTRALAGRKIRKIPRKKRSWMQNGGEQGTGSSRCGAAKRSSSVNVGQLLPTSQHCRRGGGGQDTIIRPFFFLFLLLSPPCDSLLALIAIKGNRALCPFVHPSARRRLSLLRVAHMFGC